MLRQLKSLFLYDGLENEEIYNDIIYDIKEQNRRNLLAYNIVLVGFFSVLFLISCFAEVLEPNRMAYFISIFPFAVLAVILSLIKNKLVLNTIVTYVFLSIIGGFLIIIGVIMNPSGSAVGFNIFLALAPFMAYDKMIRSIIYRIFMCVVFIVCLFKIKKFDIALEDTVNVICYGSVGAIIGALNQKRVTSAFYMRKNLEEARIKAEDASRAKSTFLATMSHEVRTPINGILGMNTILMNKCTDENLLEYAYNIQSSGNTLLSIINDILDISKIESGKMNIVPVEYQIFNVLNDCYNMTLPRVQDKGLNFIMDIDENIPSRLYGDEIRIRQVFNNLLSNAAKYTNEGEIRLKLRYEKIDEDNIKLIAEISDTGIGIKKEDINRLFESFTRLDEEKNRNIEGTGLGLNLTRELLTLMNGTINVESEYGKGTVFTIEISQKVISFEAIGNFEKRMKEKIQIINNKKHDLKIPDARILVVDDVDMNLRVAKALLERTEAKVDTIKNGTDCVKILNKKKYDLVFLDHMMPGMDGIETLKMFKDSEKKYNSETPFIMLSANATPGAKEEYQEVGFTDYLAKPILIDDLYKILKEYIS